MLFLDRLWLLVSMLEIKVSEGELIGLVRVLWDEIIEVVSGLYII